MSHFEINTELKVYSLICLERAAKALGLQLNVGQETWKWYGKWVDDFHGETAAYKNGIETKDYGKCLHAIVDPLTPDGYEIGLVANPAEKVGGLLPVLDTFGSKGAHILGIVGERFRKLCQLYWNECCIEAAQVSNCSYEWEWVGNEIEGTITDFNHQGG